MTQPTLKQLHSICLTYRHDYGILDDQARELLRDRALDWFHAFEKEGLVSRNESIEGFRKYIQDRLDELGDDNPFGQPTSSMMICRELRKALEKFESLIKESRQ